MTPEMNAYSGDRPSFVRSEGRTECVPYARQVSGIQIYGDAHTWWAAAEGEYRRGNKPSVGAVMVFSKSSSLTRGHVAIDDGEIKAQEGYGKFVKRPPVTATNKALSTWKELTSPRKIERSGIPATGV